MRFLYIIFFTFAFSLTGLAVATPTQTPIPPAFFQQTQQSLLAESLASLTQVISKLSHAQAALLDLLAFTQNRAIEMQIRLQEVMMRLGYGLLILIFLLLCYFEEDEPEPKKQKTSPKAEIDKKPPELSEENDTRDEYDFMSTQQAIPAKLDLARAYMDMGDPAAAKQVLQEVILKGDESQAHEAKQLIASLS